MTAGSDWHTSKQWVAKSVYEALEAAQEAAEELKDDPDATKKAVAAAIKALEDALAVWVPQDGLSLAEKGDLIALRAEAEEELKKVAKSADGEDVPKIVDWVPAAVYDDLEEALETARAVAADKDSAQTLVDATKDALQDAIDAFKAAIKKGSLEPSAVKVTFAGPKDETITLPAGKALSIAKNESMTVTVEADFDSYAWYVDGARTAGTGDTYVLKARNHTVGTHTLSVRVTKAGVVYSKYLTFTVSK